MHATAAVPTPNALGRTSGAAASASLPAASWEPRDPQVVWEPRDAQASISRGRSYVDSFRLMCARAWPGDRHARAAGRRGAHGPAAVRRAHDRVGNRKAETSALARRPVDAMEAVEELGMLCRRDSR